MFCSEIQIHDIRVYGNNEPCKHSSYMLHYLLCTFIQLFQIKDISTK